MAEPDVLLTFGTAKVGGFSGFTRGGGKIGVGEEMGSEGLGQ